MGNDTIAAQEEPRALRVARGLEEMAAWLREHPEFPVSWGCVSGERIYDFSSDSADLRGEKRASFEGFAELLGAVRAPSQGDVQAYREFAGGVDIVLGAPDSLWSERTPTEPSPLPESLRRFAPEPESAVVV